MRRMSRRRRRRVIRRKTSNLISSGLWINSWTPFFPNPFLVLAARSCRRHHCLLEHPNLKVQRITSQERPLESLHISMPSAFLPIEPTAQNRASSKPPPLSSSCQSPFVLKTIHTFVFSTHAFAPVHEFPAVPHCMLSKVHAFLGSQMFPWCNIIFHWQSAKAHCSLLKGPMHSLLYDFLCTS